MDEIVFALESTIAKDEQVLLEMRTLFDDIISDMKVEQEDMQQFKLELLYLEKRTETQDLYHFAIAKTKIITEYLSRLSAYVEYFNEHFPQLLYYIKRVRIQVAMAQSQVKFQYDAFADAEVMEKFSENITLLVGLVRTASERVSQLQNFYTMSYELITQVQTSKKNISEKVATLKPETT